MARPNNPHTTIGPLVKKYLEKYPKTSTRNKTALALLIYDEYKHLFEQREYYAVECIRGVLRYYKGLNGEKARKHLIDRRFL